MSEDILDVEIRNSLEKVDVPSQREMKHAIYRAVENGKSSKNPTMVVKTTLELPSINLTHTIEDELK